mgnify:CR=1 FL=1
MRVDFLICTCLQGKGAAAVGKGRRPRQASVAPPDGKFSPRSTSHRHNPVCRRTLKFTSPSVDLRPDTDAKSKGKSSERQYLFPIHNALLVLCFSAPAASLQHFKRRDTFLALPCMLPLERLYTHDFRRA